MELTWADVVKLVVPFATAVLMVWIKGWIESHNSRINKQHALSRLLNDSLRSSPEAVRALRGIGESTANGHLRLVSFDVSSLVPRIANELADLDAKRAYLYAELSSMTSLVSQGLSRLSALTLARAGSSSDSVSFQTGRATIGQTKITATDLVAMSKSALEVLKGIPARRRFGADPQSMKDLEAAVQSAEEALSNWPQAPTSTKS